MSAEPEKYDYEAVEARYMADRAARIQEKKDREEREALESLSDGDHFWRIRDPAVAQKVFLTEREAILFVRRRLRATAMMDEYEHGKRPTIVKTSYVRT